MRVHLPEAQCQGIEILVQIGPRRGKHIALLREAGLQFGDSGLGAVRAERPGGAETRVESERSDGNHRKTQQTPCFASTKLADVPPILAKDN